MKHVNILSLKGGERLAKEISTSSGLILMPVGTILKENYIIKLGELNIQDVFIEEPVNLIQNIGKVEKNREEEIKEQCQAIVIDTLERYSYCGNAELSRMKDIAQDIIYDIMDEPEVVYSVSGIRQKSEEIYSHSLNVCALSVLLAVNMKMEKKRIEKIAVGSLLHDIGYTFVNADLNARNLSELDETAKKEIKKHVIYGYEAVESENWLPQTAKDIILTHHEMLDGSGYPFRLQADKIRIESRIVRICDEFDRLVYGMDEYRTKVHEAIEYISSRANILFDFQIVQVFLASVAAFPNGTKVMTNEGKIGIVVRQNPKCPTRPVIRILEDLQEKDLTKELTLFITDSF